MAEAVAGQRRVLVGLDGSVNAFNAFDWYMKHVHKPTDYIIVAYSPNITASVITADFLAPGDISKVSDAVSAAHEAAKDVKDLLEEKLKQSGAHGSVKMLSSSNPGHAIVKEAEKENISLIVIGSRGHGVLRRTFLGSVSGYIVHHSHVPVLVHPDPHHHHHKHHSEHNKEH